MEREAMDAQREEGALRVPPPAHLPAALEWWTHNFSLISDVVTRRYSMFMVAYDSVVQSPEETLGEVFDWLGNGDVGPAIAQVRPQLRTQDAERLDGTDDAASGLDPEVIEVFDELYETVFRMREIDQQLVDRLNATNERLSERIDGALREVARQRHERAEMIRQAQSKAA
jgi:hypothetical protein